MPEVRQGEEMSPGGYVSAASPEWTNQCTLCWRDRGWWLREQGLDAYWAFLLFSEAGEERKVCLNQTVAAVLVAAASSLPMILKYSSDSILGKGLVLPEGLVWVVCFLSVGSLLEKCCGRSKKVGFLWDSNLKHWMTTLKCSYFRHHRGEEMEGSQYL